MDYELIFPGRFLKGADLQGKDVTLTIKGVKIETMKQGKEEETKGIVSFEKTERELGLNRTNAEALKLMFGRETKAWVGKRLTLYPLEMDDPFADPEDGPPPKILAIRVRGSPDITEVMKATVPRGRKVLRITVRPTGTKGAAPASNGKAPVDPPAAATEAQAPAVSEPPPDVLLPGQEGFEPGANG